MLAPVIGRFMMDNRNELFLKNLNFIISATGIGLWNWEPDTGKVIYSPEWERIAGYEPGELPQTIESWTRLVFPEDMPEVDKALEAHIAAGTPSYAVAFRMRKKDGSVVWAQDKGFVTEWHANGRAKRIVGVTQDVTAMKKTQEELSVKNEQMDCVARLAGLGAWDWSLLDDRIAYNEEYLDMVGYAQSEITGTIEEWKSFIHPEDLAVVGQKLDAYINGETDSYSGEARVRHRDGHYIWTLDVGRIVEWDEDGKPTRVLGGHLNIDRIKKTETELQTALAEIEDYNRSLSRKIEEGIAQLEEERQAGQSLYNANPQINFIASQSLEVIDCNPATLSFYGFKNKDEFIQGLFSKIDGALQKKALSGNAPVPLSGRLQSVAAFGETAFETVLTFDGEDIPFHFVLKKVPYKGTWVVAVYQTDLRRLKKMEKDLERRDILLSAVNAVASRLMSVDNVDFMKCLWDSIALLGRSVDVERVTVWENYTEDGALYCTQVHEWSEGVEMQHGQAHTINIQYAKTVPTWQSILESKQCVNALVKNMIPVERAQMEKQGIVSMLVVPIFIRDAFWGFVGYDDCVNERVFTEAEESSLRSGGLLLASALLRNEMTSNLIAAKEAALSSANAKTAFLANMSHEIRTPMNAIIGMTSIAKTADTAEKMEDCLDKISIASRHLLGVINDILDMSKIEARKFALSYETFDFDRMVNNVCAMSASKLEEKCQCFTLDCDPCIPKRLVGDELRLAQVITNLLSNAVKFTPEHGSIRLDINQTGAYADDVELFVSVTDTGIGISPEQQASLFNAFEQADRGISRKYGGTGLGLAISKNIIELMGGNVCLDSMLGKGSSFSFSVRLRKADDEGTMDETAAEEMQEEYDFTGKRILLVEDVDINREIILALLEDTHVAIDCAENGQIALDIFGANQELYDLIFMDIHMPVMDGYTATERLRAMSGPRAQSVPIIAMTANAFKEDIDKCKAVGMNGHVAKPVDYTLLLEKMSKYLQ